MITKRVKYSSRNLEGLRSERKRIKAKMSPTQRALVSETLRGMNEGSLNPSIEWMREAFGADFFTNITLDAQHNRLVGAYNEVRTSWNRIANVRNVSNFKLQHAVAASGFEDLDTVLENGTYQLHRIEDEDRGSYTLVKRGNIFALSLEAMANEELGVFGMKMEGEGKAAARTLDKFVMTTNLSSNPTIYDGVALIHGTHNNLVSGALSQATLKTAITNMQKQTGIKSTEEIMIRPHTLVVHPDEEFLARSLLESERLIATDMSATIDSTGPDKNVLMGMVPNLEVTVRQVSGKAVLLANPSQVDMFELGFWRGMAAPETFTENPGSPSEFDTDSSRWKVRHIYHGAWRDFRGVQGINY